MLDLLRLNDFDSPASLGRFNQWVLQASDAINQLFTTKATPIGSGGSTTIIFSSGALSTADLVIVDPLTINPLKAGVQRLELTMDVLTTTLLDAIDGTGLELEVTQDAIGGWQFNWPPQIVGTGQFAVGPGLPSGQPNATTTILLRSGGPGIWIPRGGLTTNA